MSKKVVYLLCGLPGSGKTFYAKNNLKSDSRDLYSSDEWVIQLYGNDFDSSNYDEYEKKAKKEILASAEKSLSLGTDVVLDFGFWKKKERDEIITWARNLAADPQIYYFKADFNLLSDRLNKRNKDKKEDSLFVSREMLQTFIKQFEEPSSDEMYKVIESL